MASHVDILEQRESLRSPFAQSLALHGVIIASLAAFAWYEGRGRVLWGDPNSLGGAIGITPVSQLPLASRGGLVNPVANDTESTIPLRPRQAKPERAKPAANDDAVRIKSRNAPRQPAANRQNYRNITQERPNQLYSTEGQALSSPMFGGMAGSGGVGIGAGSPFGTRYGYYVELLRRRVAEKWRTTDVDPRLTTAPPVIVTFDIQRDGSVRNLRLIQRSGDYTLDYSAQRAVTDASPLPPLPPGFERNSATIEFWFQLKR